jgi:arylamine N-acetyltransferase
MALHLKACPFENLSLHYSPKRTVDLESEFLFDKFVNRRRGGYCMEQNRLFSTVLRSLGYDVYTVGARVLSGLPAGQVLGWCHMAIILTLDGIEYLVDVGYGSNSLTAPLPIYDGKIIDGVISGVVPEQHRICLSEIEGSAKKGHKIWTLQSRRNAEAEWETQYVFEKDFEFYGPDYEVYLNLGYGVDSRMNMSTSQDPGSLFLNTLVCTNVEYNKDLNAISRNILVNSEIKKRENGETTRIKLFEREEHRLQALKDVFGIELSTEEEEAIKGQKLAVDNWVADTKQLAF